MSDSSPVLFALDTATDRVHLALVAGAQTWVADLPGGAQASSSLLPAVQDLLAQSLRTWSEVDAIGFGSGPGAFTGLRTACSTAQGLALGLDCPVIAIDTLMAVAEDARASDPTAWAVGDVVWVLQDARMDELYVAAYAWQAPGWQAVQAPQLWALSEPGQRWAQQAPAHLAGSGLQAYPDAFASVAAGLRWLHAAPRGAALAELARQAWAKQDVLDAALALPRYVRDKVAQTTAERMAARA